MQNRLEGIRFEENCGESGRSCLFKNITRRDRLGILDGFRWYPKEHEGFPGRTCGAQESTGVEKVYSLVGFRWPGHSRARALHLRLCARRRQGVAHPFLSAPSHGNAVEAFARTLFDLTSLSLPLSLSFSLSLLAPFPLRLPLPFPLSLSFSRFLLFSLLLCQSARFRTAKEYLKRCIFRIISIHPHRIHPARGSIIHCTAR